MKTARIFFFASCCVLLSPLTSTVVQAQSYYDVEGVVYGPNTMPLRGAAVFLEDQTRTRVGQSITDTDGRYRFTRVGAGVYYIVVKPNDKQLQSTVQRVELINTSVLGTNLSVERVDITLGESTRLREAVSATVFAQDVPPAAVSEYERAIESLAKKNHEQALRQLNHALEIFPDYFAASQQLGLLQVEGEQYRQAIPHLVKAIEINPKAAPSYLALGIASVRLGRPDLALDALQRARSMDEKSFRVHFFMGLALLDLDRLDEAESSFKESYKLGGASKAASAHLYLASIYSRRGRTREAIGELQGYLRENPKAGNADNVREAINKLKAKL